MVGSAHHEWIWRQDGLKVPAHHPKRGGLWLNDGSRIRLRPERRDHVWAYELAEDRTHERRKFRMPNAIDEHAHECSSIRINGKPKISDVIDVPSDLSIGRGMPDHIRSDSGLGLVAAAVQRWTKAIAAKTAYIMLGSPRENGYVVSFNARPRDNSVNCEILYPIREAEIIGESWRRHYDTVCPHASLGYRPPTPEMVPAHAAWPAPLTRPAPPANLPVAPRPTLHQRSRRITQWRPIR